MRIGETIARAPHDLPARNDELEQLAIDLDRDIDFLTWEPRPAALEGRRGRDPVSARQGHNSVRAGTD
jgi:hypothetical protein